MFCSAQGRPAPKARAVGTENLGFLDAAKVLLKTVPFSVGIYWIILSVLHAFDYYGKYHERELRTSELEMRLAQAKLQALQMQLNSPFSFQHASHDFGAYAFGRGSRGSDGCEAQ